MTKPHWSTPRIHGVTKIIIGPYRQYGEYCGFRHIKFEGPDGSIILSIHAADSIYDNIPTPDDLPVVFGDI